MYFRTVLWKCYENIFDDLKSRVMKVDEEGLEEKGRKETKERQKEERERERERERELLARRMFTRAVCNESLKRGHFHEARKAVYLHCAW